MYSIKLINKWAIMKKMVVSARVVGILAVLGVVVLRPAFAQEPAFTLDPAFAQEQVVYNFAKPAVVLLRGSVNLVQLEDLLNESPGIGFWTKLLLKDKLAEILWGVDRHHEGSGKYGIETLKARFFSLADETATKLKSSDPSLSNTIASSRDDIWEALLQR